MTSRLLRIWDALRTSFWFVPAVMAVGAIVLAYAVAAFDRAVEIPTDGIFRWLRADSADAVRAMLSTIMGSAITVLSVVFSITIVALTLAASQFGPRLLRNFMRDRVTQVVLGVFSATFIYCLLVMQMVQSGAEDEWSFVPHLAVLTAVVLSVVSLGVLIYFIHHIARSIQAPEVISRVCDELMAVIERTAATADDGMHAGQEELAVRQLRASTAEISLGRTGYIQFVQTDDLVELARDRDVMIEVTRRAGQFLAAGETIARVYPAPDDLDVYIDEIRDAIVVGAVRTDAQDLEHAVRQLVEIALRALSPGINDPYTAVNCIDRLSAAIADLAQRRLPDGYVYDTDGRLRVVKPVTTFTGVCNVAFHQIRQHGCSHPAVTIRLLAGVERIARFAQHDQQVETLRHHAAMVFRSAARHTLEINDRADIARAYDRVASVLDAAGSTGVRHEAVLIQRPDA